MSDTTSGGTDTTSGGADPTDPTDPADPNAVHRGTATSIGDTATTLDPGT